MYECRQEDLSFFETAPQRFTFERVLEAPIDVVWQVLEDPESWPKWAPGLKKVTWTTPRPFGVGTKRTVTLAAGFEVYEVFLAWEATRMAFVLEGHNQRVWWAMGEDYHLEDLGDGRTRWTWTVAYDPRGVFRAIHPLVKPGMRWNLGRIADGLPEYVKALGQGATAAAPA